MQTPWELIEDLPTLDPRAAVDRLVATMVALEKGGGTIHTTIRAWHDPDEDGAAAIRGYEWEVADETWEPCREIMRIELEDELIYKLWWGAVYASCRMRNKGPAAAFADAIGGEPGALASPGDLVEYAKRVLPDQWSDEALERALRRLRGEYIIDGMHRCQYDMWLKALAISRVPGAYAKMQAKVAFVAAHGSLAEMATGRAVLHGARTYAGCSFLEALAQLICNVAGDSGQPEDVYERIGEMIVADLIDDAPMPRPYVLRKC